MNEGERGFEPLMRRGGAKTESVGRSGGGGGGGGGG